MQRKIIFLSTKTRLFPVVLRHIVISFIKLLYHNFAKRAILCIFTYYNYNTYTRYVGEILLQLKLSMLHPNYVYTHIYIYMCVYIYIERERERERERGLRKRGMEGRCSETLSRRYTHRKSNHAN